MDAIACAWSIALIVAHVPVDRNKPNSSEQVDEVRIAKSYSNAAHLIAGHVNRCESEHGDMII